MPRWTVTDLIAYAKQHNLSLAGICPNQSQPDSRTSLEQNPPRKTASICGPSICYQVTFIVYRTKPVDWDNSFTKPMQDGLVEFGLLPGDDWDQLQGKVISRKCGSRAEERTVIVIERL